MTAPTSFPGWATPATACSDRVTERRLVRFGSGWRTCFGRSEADVLVPDVGTGGDEVGEQGDTLVVVHIKHLAAVLGEPVVAAREVARLTEDEGSDAELAHEPAA